MVMVVKMPRKARIDAPGAVHHIMARGIERRKIFYDDQDRDAFVERLAGLVRETRTTCCAWALIPNHFHLLLKTGLVPIATIMRRLLTGYAIGFNRRHRRSGHVFQNRYKSILCEQDPYLVELVRYIHLNPLRARLLKDLKALDTYRYTGHSCVMGRRINDWQNVDLALSYFDDRRHSARRLYREFIKEGIALGHRKDLVGGGLIRSTGGWKMACAMRRAGLFIKSDERILGSSAFVEAVLSRAQEHLDIKATVANRGVTFDDILNAVAGMLSVAPEDIVGGGKMRKVVKVRNLVSYWSVTHLSLSLTEIGRRLGISISTVSGAVKRGRHMVNSEGLKLEDMLDV